MKTKLSNDQLCGDCNLPVESCTCKTVLMNANSSEQGVNSTGAIAQGKNSPGSPVDTVIGDRYKIERTIGVGGMGTVYEARHIVLENSVALKVLNSELVEEQSVLKRFEQEARACASLNHPNLVNVYDCGITDDDQPYIVMEYLEGEHLLEKLKSVKVLSIADFIEIFLQIISALGYAHGKGVIHRDLKPTNIILTQGPKRTSIPKLVDFGIAKIEDLGGNIQMLTQTGEVFGSPAYMSPEQCAGNTVDQRSDIYSLGCVMYEALTGKQAFPGHNMMTVLEKQLNEKPKSFSEVSSDVPEKLQEVILKCLEKNPDDRFENCSQLHKTLSDYKRETEKPSIVNGRNVLILLFLFISSSALFLFNNRERVERTPSSATAKQMLPAEQFSNIAYADYAASRLVLPDAIEIYQKELVRLKKKKVSFNAKLPLLTNMIRLYSYTARHKEGMDLYINYKEALNQFEKNSDRQTYSPATCNNLVMLYEFAGYCHGQLNKKFDAENLYLKAIRLSSELPVSDWIKVKLHLDYSAYLKETLNRGADSLKQAKIAQQIVFSMPKPRQKIFSGLLINSYRRQAWACWSLQDYKQAELTLRKSLQISANSPSSWYVQDDFRNLIAILNEQGKAKEVETTKEQRKKVLVKMNKKRVNKRSLSYRRFHLGPYMLDYQKGR